MLSSDISSHYFSSGFECLRMNDALPIQQAMTAAKAFFARAQADKDQFVRSDHPEIGYRAIYHKECLMCRDAQSDPAFLVLAEHLHQISLQCLQQIERMLGHKAGTLVSLADQHAIPNQGYGHSLLRVNHYQHHPSMSEQAVLSEAHQDLGLLTLVCQTDSNALEIYDHLYDGDWLDVEAQCEKDSIILMTGETLSTISNQICLPATHRVRNPMQDRTSLVYHLRPRAEAVLDSRLLETDITGPFERAFCMTGEAYLQSEIAKRYSVNGSY